MEWNVHPNLIEFGPLTVRYYGLMFMLAFLCGYAILGRVFKEENKSSEDLEDLFIYVFVGTVLGARLGHILFYNPMEYLANPLEILKIWHGGLASHGAIIGIALALYLYARKRSDQTFFWVMDRIAMVVALGGFFVRLGNFFNHEIIGRPTDLPWGIKFLYYQSVNTPNLDAVARHPSQLYESLAYLLVFGLMYWIYQQKKDHLPQGFLSGIFFILVFGFRFFVEFLKEDQELWEASIPLLNMGQLLSIPVVLVGVFLIFQSRKLGPLLKSPTPPAPRAETASGKKKKVKKKAR